MSRTAQSRGGPRTDHHQGGPEWGHHDTQAVTKIGRIPPLPGGGPARFSQLPKGKGANANGKGASGWNNGSQNRSWSNGNQNNGWNRSSNSGGWQNNGGGRNQNSGWQGKGSHHQWEDSRSAGRDGNHNGGSNRDYHAVVQQGRPVPARAALPTPPRQQGQSRQEREEEILRLRQQVRELQGGRRYRTPSPDSEGWSEDEVPARNRGRRSPTPPPPRQAAERALESRAATLP